MTNSEQAFWDWFLKHEGELFEMDHTSEREPLLDQLANAIQQVHPNLSFEFGPPAQTREFVISASGQIEAFPAVASLVHAAPNLERWQVIAFRPPRVFESCLEWRGRKVRTEDVRFRLLDNGKNAGIELFIAGYREDDPDIMQVGYLLLDHMLGEFQVETQLGLITMHSLDADSADETYPLSKLPELLERLLSQLERRSEKPN